MEHPFNLKGGGGAEKNILLALCALLNRGYMKFPDSLRAPYGID